MIVYDPLTNFDPSQNPHSIGLESQVTIPGPVTPELLRQKTYLMTGLQGGGLMRYGAIGMGSLGLREWFPSFRRRLGL